MTTCQGCQERLFEYVYGLLDEPEMAVAIQKHMAQCAGCEQSYQKVLQQQKMLAQASRFETAIQFAAPKVEISKPVTLRTRSQVTAWYVSIASLVFALLVGMGGVYWYGQSTKGQALAMARERLDELNRSMPLTDKSDLLTQQIKDQEKNIAELSKNLANLESKTQQDLMAKTAYQQVLVPTSVQANTDAPVVVLNNLLNGQPAPMSALQLGMRGTESGQSAQNYQYQNRQTAASNKLNFSVPSLAYQQYAGKVISNEVLQDTQPLNGLQKITHPLEILKAEYAAHLCLDKPLYQPGEELFFRAVALDKTTFSACREQLQFLVKLVGPDQKVLSTWNKTAQLFDTNQQQLVRDFQGKPLHGVASGSFVLPEKMPLGESQLILTEKNDRFPPQVTTFLVSSFAPPLFNKSFQFDRVSYSPGEQVIVTGQVNTTGNQPLKDSIMESQITIDGEQYNLQGKKTADRITGKTDAFGKVRYAFTLPEKVTQGQGTLSFRFTSPVGTETWTQPFRIETNRLQVHCYPEGGDLIAGTTNRVYFEVKNDRGEPVDSEAELLDSQNQIVATLNTFHDESESKVSRGMGSFQFIPKSQDSYRLRSKRPANQAVSVNLPAVKPSGTVLHIEKSVLPAHAALQLQISNQGKPRELVVSVHCRGVLIALDQYRMPADGKQLLQIKPVAAPGGVYRVTISELSSATEPPQLIPLAERLVYRQPDKNLGLKLSTRQEPGKPLMLGIDAVNEAQQPVPAFVTIAGVNQSLLQLADTSTQRSLPAHFLLAQEVRQPEELEHADFFLSQHPRASQALDLLLGVQGWRRFKEVNAPELAARINNFNRLPIHYFDNRQEMLDQVKLRTRASVQESSLSKDLAAAQERLSSLKKDLDVQTLLSKQTLQEKELSIKKAEQQKYLREQEWSQFSTWFHILSAGLLCITSLTGLAAVCIKRTFLPWHLILTLGGLSVLGFAGTALLWKHQTEPVQIKTIERGKSMELREPPAAAPAGLEFTESSQTPTARTASGGATGSGDRSGKNAVTLVNPSNAVSAAKPSGNAVLDAGPGEKQAERRQAPSVAMPPAAVPGKELEKAMAMKNDNLPSPQLSSMRSANKDTAPPQAPGKVQITRQNKKLPFAIDYHLTLEKGATGKLSIEPGNANAKDSLAENLRVNRDIVPGGIGGFKQDKTVPPPSRKEKSANTSDKKNEAQDFVDAQNNEAKAANFFVREYAWGQESLTRKPLASWTQTVFWKPFQMIPPQGRIELPVHLPENEGVYRFDVFGFDGAGRLGASTIDISVKATAGKAKPLTLETRIRQAEARINDVVQLECQLQNTTSRLQPNIIVKINLPAGLRLPENLKQINAAIKASKPTGTAEPVRWNMKGSELTLEIPELATEQSFRVVLDLVCQETGEFTAKPSKAYLENQIQDATDSSPLTIRIKQR